MRRSEEPRHKSEKNFHFTVQWAPWHVSLPIAENRTQKYPKLTSLQYFEIDIPGNFQKWKFLFFSIFSKFCFKKFSFCCTMFLCWPPRIHLSTTLNEKFSKMKIFVFLNFLEIFFRLMPGFLRSPQKYFSRKDIAQFYKIKKLQHKQNSTSKVKVEVHKLSKNNASNKFWRNMDDKVILLYNLPDMLKIGKTCKEISRKSGETFKEIFMKIWRNNFI